jgi:hypothetical protein
VNNFGSYCLVLPWPRLSGGVLVFTILSETKSLAMASNGGAVQLIGSTLELSAGDALPTVLSCQNASGGSHRVCQ